MVQDRRKQYQSKKDNYGGIIHEIAKLAINIVYTVAQVSVVVNEINFLKEQMLNIKPNKEPLLLKENN